MTYTEKIEKLIDLDLTSYRIAKETGISTQYIDKIRSGKTAIENIGLGKAEILVKYFDDLEKNISLYDVVFSFYISNINIFFNIFFDSQKKTPKNSVELKLLNPF